MRDESPDPRFLQANERTLLAWVRTGLTLMAFGIVIARISVWLQAEHPERNESSFGLWTGIGVVVLGTACLWVGAARFVRARRAILAKRTIDEGVKAPVLITLAVSAFGVAAAGYLATTAG